MKKIGLVAGKSGDSLTDKLLARGFEVFLIGGKANEPGMNTASYVGIYDLQEHYKIYKFFYENGVEKVIFGTGHNLALELANYLNIRQIKTNINYTLSMIEKDKIAFKQLLNIQNFKTPKYLFFSSVNEEDINEITREIGIPCVIKSATDATQPVKANSYDELIKAINLIENTKTQILVEQYIEGNDCTVAVVYDGVNVRSLGVTYYSKAKEYQLEGFDIAYSKKMNQETEDKLEKIAREVVKKNNFEGLTRVDFIIDKTENIPYVLELNSVIVTGYTGTSYKSFEEQNIDIAEVMTDISLKILDRNV